MNMNHQKVEKHGLHEAKDTPRSGEQDLTNSLKGQQPPTHDNGRTSTAEDQSMRKCQDDGAAAVSVIIGQMIAYLGERAHPEDLHVLSFCLQQLYGRMDYLYRFALPELMKPPPLTPGAEPPPLDDLLRRHDIWTKLRSIKATLNRMELLCNLLNDAATSILDALDLAGEAQIFLEEKPLLQSQTAADEQEWLHVLNQERRDLALTNLTACLCLWQEEYSQNPLLADCIGQVHPAVPSLAPLDDVFATLLDSAGSIFGEVLPHFHALSPGDDEIAVTLFFDLMQQVDELLRQFDLALEPLHALTGYFSVMPHC